MATEPVRVPDDAADERLEARAAGTTRPSARRLVIVTTLLSPRVAENSGRANDFLDFR
jgi:hypothetical protein